jgi:hypothetical protein
MQELRYSEVSSESSPPASATGSSGGTVTFSGSSGGAPGDDRDVDLVLLPRYPRLTPPN